jgi:histidyl-tRNA synthetase
MVRAGISNGLLHNQRQKLWTVGPMFRYEKPQKGRYRQFNQVDLEAMGYSGPDVDAELIILCKRMWQRLGLSRLTLEINSLGTNEARSSYRQKLVEYFETVKNKLDADSIRRLGKNPLRILDSKNPDLAEIIAGAPVMIDYLDEESAQHFAEFKALLDAAGVEYTVNPRLVRGLDYYNRTVFEWVTDALGSQGAVCSGGRYDGLVEKLGGRSTPAIGWAMGVERLVDLFIACGGVAPGNDPHVYVVAAGEKAFSKAFELAEELRDGIDAVRIEVNMGGGSFKSQLKRADKSGALYALILGEEEIASGTIGLKALRSREDQATVPLTNIVTELGNVLGKLN